MLLGDGGCPVFGFIYRQRLPYTQGYLDSLSNGGIAGRKISIGSSNWLKNRVISTYSDFHLSICMLVNLNILNTYTEA